MFFFFNLLIHMGYHQTYFLFFCFTFYILLCSLFIFFYMENCIIDFNNYNFFSTPPTHGLSKKNAFIRSQHFSPHEAIILLNTQQHSFTMKGTLNK